MRREGGEPSAEPSREEAAARIADHRRSLRDDPAALSRIGGGFIDPAAAQDAARSLVARVRAARQAEAELTVIGSNSRRDRIDHVAEKNGREPKALVNGTVALLFRNANRRRRNARRIGVARNDEG